MLKIDMPMPDNCGSCPCSYMILTGEHSGELMCCALEWKDMRAAEHPLSFREEWLLDTRNCTPQSGRPEKCPIVGETEKGPSERQP